MAKRDDYLQGRSEGMAFALKIAKEGGVEALEKEIRMRNIWGLHVNVPMKDLQDIKDKITLRVVDIVACVALLTLRDEFGFGGRRGRQFLARFEKKVECVVGDPEDGQSVTLEDYLQAVKDEMGISLTVSEGIGRRNGT
ncbi:MAG: hypothetical protein HFI66_04805 [Lachnospiraceae bacterium]|nr:hypothetical protein [Lachnospiraceae bacterium]